LNTPDFLDAVLARLPEPTIVVSALGRTGEELYRRKPKGTLFTDTMGDVLAVSLGIAVAAPSVQVFAIDTDGSFLMNLSSLITLGAVLPTLSNYGLAIIDNGIYESAGGLPSRQCDLDWSQLFRAVRINTVIADSVELIPRQLLATRTAIIAVVKNDDAVPLSTKPMDGVTSSTATQEAIAKLLHITPRPKAQKV
jgi:thiamine pyrophosphate-dependent acetolactate synthase large subunit-like protein